MIWITILHRDFLKAGVWECWAPVRKIFKSCLFIRILKGKTNVCLRIFQFMLLLLLSRFSRVRLCNPIAHQAPPSLGFSRQEHWSGLPFPSPMHEREKWKWSRSVESDSSRPHGLPPTRLLHPWDFPGKSTKLYLGLDHVWVSLPLCWAKTFPFTIQFTAGTREKDPWSQVTKQWKAG